MKRLILASISFAVAFTPAASAQSEASQTGASSTSQSAGGDAQPESGRTVTQSANTATFRTTSVINKAIAPADNASAIEVESEPPASSTILKGGTTDSSKYEDALAIEAPQPALPTEHQEKGIKASCVARFIIDEQGKFQVRLLTSTGSQEADEMALETLKKWKFKPAMLDGKAVRSTRKIRIEFEIE